MSEGLRHELILQSLLLYETSLRNGESGDTLTMATDPDVVKEVQLGQEALLQLEAVIPRRMKAMPSWAPSQIGRFEIISVLGSGGFAVVYLANDPSLHRFAAVKIPRPHVLADQGHQQRFVNEARAWAKLDHPNIVPVYESGRDGDLPYIACAWCKGPTLRQWLHDQSSPPRPRLAARIVELLAFAVQYSHDRGIFHRDIKPGNVLLFPRTADDNSDFPFVPRLSDFGLAKFLETEPSDALMSQLIGTLQYMAPERISDGPSNDVAADVYGLGAVLYCLLIGRPPFESASTTETLQLIVERDAVAPFEIIPGIGRDLSLICLKCLQKSPHLRYATAAELGQDLNRYLSGRPVRARQTPAWVRLQKWCLQRPMVATLLGATLSLAVLLIILAVRYTKSLQELRGQLQASNVQLKDRVNELAEAVNTAVRHKRNAEEVLFASDLHMADSLRHEGDMRGTLRILNKYDYPTTASGTINGRESFAWRFIRNNSTMPSVDLPDTKQIVWDMKLSPDSSLLAMCGNKGMVRILVASDDFRLVVEQKVADTELNCVAWCDCEPLLATSGDDGLVHICDSRTLQVIRPLPAMPGNRVYGIEFLPGTTRLLVTGCSSEVQLWDAASGEPLDRVVSPHDRIIECLDVSPDGTHFATGGDDGHMCLWNMADMSVIKKNCSASQGFVGPVNHTCFTRDGKYVVVSSAKKSLLLYDAVTGEQVSEWRGLDNISGVAIQDRYVVCADMAGLLSEFALDDPDPHWNPRIQWCGHEDKISSIVLLPIEANDRQTSQFISADRSANLRLWGSNPDSQAIELPAVQSEAHCSATAMCWQNSFTLFRCGTQIIETFNTMRRKSEGYFSGPSLVSCCCYAEEALCLVFANDQGEVAVIPDGQQILTPTVVFEGELLTDLSVDARATRAVVRGSHDNVAILDLQNNIILATLEDREASVISPDGRWVISASRVKDAFEVFDGKTMCLHTALQEFDPTYASATFSMDSSVFVATNYDRTITVWNTNNWTTMNRFATQSRFLSPIALHADGRTLASSDEENQLQLWDIRSGRHLADLGSMPDNVCSMRFSPDGESLAVCYGNLKVKVIRADR